MQLTFVSPISEPMSGGAAQYARFLTDHLPGTGVFETIRVLTERLGDGQAVATEAHESVRVEYALAPFFSSRGRGIGRILRYVLQNLQYLGLLRLARGGRTHVVMVHGTFFLYPGIMGPTLSLLRRLAKGSVRIVLDLRDPNTPGRRMRRLPHFDAIVVCSRRLENRCREVGLRDIVHIPVPFRVPPLRSEQVQGILQEHDLERGTFLFSANGVVSAKGFDKVFDAWQELVTQGAMIDLVVAGSERDWDERYAAAAGARPGLRSLGIQPNEVVRCITSAAAVHVNPSRIEGLPRSSLEALQLEVPVIVPSGLPEFAGFDSRFIGSDLDPSILATQIKGLLESPGSPDYDLSVHEPEQVLPLYVTLFQRLFDDGS